MEGDQNKEEDVKPNQFNYSEEDLNAIYRSIVKCVGFKYIMEYEFDSKARKVHDEVVKSIPAYMIQKRSDFQPVKPLVAPFDDQMHLKTLNGYKKHDIIINCFGELKVLEKDQVGPKMFVTDFGMVLDGSKRGNQWRFLKYSLVPNCHFIQRFVKNTDDEKEVPEFLCSLAAKQDIKPGEVLQVDFPIFQDD